MCRNKIDEINLFQMKMLCYCQSDELIRKQREELILLTNQLKLQDEKLQKIYEENVILKTKLKQKAKCQLEADKTIKSLNKEINALKSELEEKESIVKSTRKKINEKDCFIQTQACRIQNLESTLNKLNQDSDRIHKSNEVEEFFRVQFNLIRF